MEKDKNTKSIRVDISTEMESGAYSNASFIHASFTEIVIDFVNTTPLPKAPKAKVVSRVILNPVHAKHLLNNLASTIQNYEENNGTIEEKPQGSGSIPFMGPKGEA